MSMIVRCSFVQLWCHVMLRCTSNFWTTCNLHHQTPKCRNLWCDILVFKMSFFVLSLLFYGALLLVIDWIEKTLAREMNLPTNWARKFCIAGYFLVLKLQKSRCWEWYYHQMSGFLSHVYRSRKMYCFCWINFRARIFL